jgi:hypothetical protein
MATLSAKLGVDIATAERVFDIDEDGLHVVLAPSKLHGTTSVAIQQLARLVVAGRQAAGLDDDWTATSAIRSVCEDRGKHDSANFATHVKKLDGDGFRLKGAGRSRELKANAAGFEATGLLVKQLAGQD